MIFYFLFPFFQLRKCFLNVLKWKEQNKNGNIYVFVFDGIWNVSICNITHACLINPYMYVTFKIVVIFNSNTIKPQAETHSVFGFEITYASFFEFIRHEFICTCMAVSLNRIHYMCVCVCVGICAWKRCQELSASFFFFISCV